MNLSHMLHEMCHDILSAPDVKAICKSRGFSDREAASRSVFEHVFLSSFGVKEAMETLTEAERAALHLLRLEDRLVDVTFFERLYGRAQVGWRGYGTFTQQFKPVFDAVQRNLVRKGVLIIGEAKTSSPNKTKMELWRYRFPPEFGSFLPPLFQPTVFSGQQGSLQADRLRTALHRLVQDEAVGPQRRETLQLGPTGLTIGTRPFSVAAVQDWRQAAWEAEILKASARGNQLYSSSGQAGMFAGYLLPDTEYRAPSPLPALRYAFSQLASDEWISPDQLAVLLDVVYAGTDHPSPATICEAGWEHGCLVRHLAGGMEYYRAVAAAHEHALKAPEIYLSTAGGKVFVDWESVPYEALELLNRIADLAIDGGRFRATPSVAKMIHALDSWREHPLVGYLQAHSADFRAVLKKLDIQWGRLIVHENLLVARITDLSLRVKLQQAFDGAGGAPSVQPIFLSGEYVAFPRALLGDIERLVKKAGHVIKTVQAS